MPELLFDMLRKLRNLAALKKVRAIFTIARLPNTIFIVVAQVLCSLCIVLPFIEAEGLLQFLTVRQHILLALSTGFIAAAGYLINDYFDLKIDSINKPKRVTVELNFRRRQIILWHVTLSAIGFIIALYCAYISKHISLALIQLLSIALLVAYSSVLKRKLFIGNISIALLTFLNVLTPALYEHQYWKPNQVRELFRNGHLSLALIAFIAVFAFMITWIREIIKDVEDLKGDKLDGCTTLPIVYGIDASKYLALTLTILLILFGLGYTIFILPSNVQETFWYKLIFQVTVTVPLIALLPLLYTAHSSKHFKQCSRLVKLITFAGILLILVLK
jgi:4-hydroxybenzoate polyprenyltransferase